MKHIKLDSLLQEIDIKMGRLISLIKVSTQLGLSGGAVYGTQQLGVWGNGKQGEQVYNKLKTVQMKDVLPAEVMEFVPDISDAGISDTVTGVCQTVGETKENFWSYYNRGVLATIQGVSNLPQTVKSYANDAIEMVQENTK